MIKSRFSRFSLLPAALLLFAVGCAQADMTPAENSAPVATSGSPAAGTQGFGTPQGGMQGSITADPSSASSVPDAVPPAGGEQVRGTVPPGVPATSDAAVSREWKGLGSTGGGTGTGESSGTIADDLPTQERR